MPRPKPTSEKAIVSVQVDKAFKDKLEDLAHRQRRPFADLVRELLYVPLGYVEKGPGK